MGRRVEIPEPERETITPAQRRRVLQRVLLEAVPLDSEAYRRHEQRIAKARTPEARAAAYERTVAELGLTDRADELLAQRQTGGSQ